MNIIFMGTPDFAVPTLQAIFDGGHNVKGVFCQPDKPKGRGHKLAAPPVKELALTLGLPVFQPTTLRNGEAIQIIKDLSPDIIVVVAYGKILPADILNTPEFGCINIHASLLPLLRGSAPIQWSILNGFKQTGVTIMQMNEGLDTGDILFTEKYDIPDTMDAAELYNELSKVGAAKINDALKAIESGDITPVKQDDSKATLAPMLTKEMSIIDWNRTASEIANKMRGLQPWPCAVTAFDGKSYKLFSPEIIEADYSACQPGEYIPLKKGFAVVCGDKKALIIGEIQAEGAKKMPTDAFLRGHAFDKGTVFGI